MVYSDKRILYPMKRIDFDPERGAQSAKPRQVRLCPDQLGRGARHGRERDQAAAPGLRARRDRDLASVRTTNGAMSAITSRPCMRFGNLIGFTRVHHNPDSWEGWYWGAMHHYGNSMRVGVSGFYGLVEDCLKEAEHDRLLVERPGIDQRLPCGFRGHEARACGPRNSASRWSTSIRTSIRLRSSSAGAWIPIKPGTDPALAIAIMNVWMNEGLYDKDYVAQPHDRLRRMARLCARR